MASDRQFALCLVEAGAWEVSSEGLQRPPLSGAEPGSSGCEISVCCEFVKGTLSPRIFPSHDERDPVIIEVRCERVTSEVLVPAVSSSCRLQHSPSDRMLAR